jgi:hypothetical protein
MGVVVIDMCLTRGSETHCDAIDWQFELPAQGKRRSTIKRCTFDF